jgi:hypothetical protein
MEGEVLEAHPSPFSGDLDAASMRDISLQGVWSLSGAKPGNGVEQLLDDNVRALRFPSACVRVCVCVHVCVCVNVHVHVWGEIESG